jgi:hypothetical protein
MTGNEHYRVYLEKEMPKNKNLIYEKREKTEREIFFSDSKTRHLANLHRFCWPTTK